jgi:hypothetical protein
MKSRHHDYLIGSWGVLTIDKYNDVYSHNKICYINFSLYVKITLRVNDEKFVRATTNLYDSVHVVRLSPITWLCTNKR